MAETCGFTPSYFGIWMDPCGDPATVNVGWSCPNRHAETTPACDEHAGLLADVRLLCPACAEEGKGDVHVQVVDEPLTAGRAGP